MRKVFARGIILSIAATFMILAAALTMKHAMSDGTAEIRPNRIRIEYVPPANRRHRDIYELVTSRTALEKVQKIFSPVRLSADLTVKTTDCGMSNAWYQRPTLTICYEYLEEIRATAPTKTTADGLTRDDALVGQFFYVVMHEMGHALFDQLDVPLFGRPEDAADGFATYMMLALGKKDAHRIITGAAYAYRDYNMGTRVTVPLTAFADDHSAPLQRYYNLLCLAYGADDVTFADFVDKGLLPRQRAHSCKVEYGELNFAIQKLIMPHLDSRLTAAVLRKDWIPPIDPRPVSGPVALVGN
jgi:hypothetical protein